MARLNCTVEELVQCVRTIYAHDLQYMPAKVWMDELHSTHTYLRATFRDGYTNRHLDRLLDLRRHLTKLHGPDADVTLVVYPKDFPSELAQLRNEVINAVP
jgi:hypothetical protein